MLYVVINLRRRTKITDYILKQNDIDTAEEKLDFWLNQLDQTIAEQFLNNIDLIALARNYFNYLELMY